MISRFETTRPSPGTEAGRRLLQGWGGQAAPSVREVLAIEAEARAALLGEVREGAWLVDAIAYAIARAPVPAKTDTARDVAARLAPLVIESGYLDTLSDGGPK